VIQGLQYFTQAYVEAGVSRRARRRRRGRDGGHARSTAARLDTRLSVLLFQHAYYRLQMGYASAMAMLLLAVSFGVISLILINSRRWVHYRRSRPVHGGSDDYHVRAAPRAPGGCSPPPASCLQSRTTPF